MKKYVHIRARGPPTPSRNEGTEKHSILFQGASLSRKGKPSLFKKGFGPRFKVQATINACSPARVSFPGRKFSQQIFFQNKRKEKCNASALILLEMLEGVWGYRTWCCCRCSGSASKEKKRKKHQQQRRQQQAMSFPTWESSYYRPSSSSLSSCSSTSCPHRSSTQQLFLSSVSTSCNNQEAKITASL
jgi:hypothetical protein